LENHRRIDLPCAARQRACDGDPDDPAKSKGKESVFQFFAPIGGINAVRMGHGAAVLREIRDTYCNGSRQSIGRDRRDGKLSAGDLANIAERIVGALADAALRGHVVVANTPFKRRLSIHVLDNF
jgi:hypothetical protein